MKLSEELEQVYGGVATAWTRREMHDGLGNRCLLGWIDQVNPTQVFGKTRLERFIWSFLDDYGKTPSSLSWFNDNRGQQEVLWMLEEAIDLAKWLEEDDDVATMMETEEKEEE